MADGFSVRADAVAAGSGQIRSLGSRAQEVGGVASAVLEEMTGAAGHPGLAQALAAMTGTGASMFAIAGAAFARSADSHAQAAQTYQDTEARTTEAIGRIGAGGIR